MKKWLLSLLTATAFCAVSAAETYCTISVDATAAKTKLADAAKDDDLVLHAPEWGNEINRTCRLVGNDDITDSGYSEISASFKPQQDCRGYIMVYGNHAPDAADRKWIMVKNITLDGKPVPNADYAKVKPNGLPSNFMEVKKLKLIKDGGTTVLSGNHDNRIGFSCQLKGGRVHTVKMMVKSCK